MSDTKKSGFDLINEAAALMAACPTDAQLEADPGAEDHWTEALCAWADAADDKVERYRAVYRQATSRTEQLKAQAAAYQRYAKREERVAARMVELATSLLGAVEASTGAPSAACSDGTSVRLLRRRQVRVRVLDESAVPRKWMRVTESVDKRAAGDALKAGEEIPGLDLDRYRSERVDWGL